MTRWKTLLAFLVALGLAWPSLAVVTDKPNLG